MSTKFVQMMTVSSSFDLFTPSKFRPHAFVWENVEKSFSQHVLKTNG